MPPKKRKLSAIVKLQIKAGAATPAPPVGPALGQHGVNIMEFCKAYNAATEAQRGDVVPVEISVYETVRSPSSSRPRPRRACCSRRPVSTRAAVSRTAPRSRR